ncbi:MAG: FtsX-like permease family protein [Firmicutes bacterium]|nr:FtsX-like permease family protein [Bacillota bacterium]
MLKLLPLSLQAVRRRWRASLLLFSVLLISFTFAVVLLCVTESAAKTNEEYRFDTYGAWYAVFVDGNEQEEEWLLGQSWLESLGASRCYGSFNGGSIGTVDDALQEMGRIVTLDGRLPEADNEIAIEARALSAMGYDYTIGQKITLQIYLPKDGKTVTILEEFTLCGVVKDYTHLWEISESGLTGSLNAALITESAAERLVAEAGADAPTVSYFFTVQPGTEEEMLSAAQTKLPDMAKTLRSYLSINTGAYGATAASKSYDFYVTLTLVITVLAVVVIYLLNLPVDVRRIARLRSLGASRAQAGLLLSFETVLLCLPAVLLGIGLGALGTWVYLRVSVYAGTVEVQLSLPWEHLLTNGGVWVASVLLVRLPTLAAALHTPLTGRMSLSPRRARFLRLFQRSAALLLSAALCGAVVFTVLHALSPLYKYRTYSSYPSYELDRLSYRRYLSQTVTQEEAETAGSIPGIREAWGFGELYGANLILPDGESVPAYVYVLDEGEFPGAFDFSGLDLEAFYAGEQALLSFPLDESGNVISAPAWYSSREDYWQPAEIGCEVGDVLTLQVGDLYETWDSELTLKGGSIEASIPIGAFSYNETDDPYYTLPGPKFSYTLVISHSFLQSLLADLPEEAYWGYYHAGDGDNYNKIYLFADLNAEYLSTDVALAQFASQNDMSLENQREEFSAKAQDYLQQLILVLASGCATIAILALILHSTLTLEAQREQRRYAILQTLGMSRRQRNRQIVRTAIGRALGAVALGWAGYLCYELSSLPDSYAGYTLLQSLRARYSSYAYDGFGLPQYVLLSALEAAAIFAICLLSKRFLGSRDLMQMLSQEK